MASPNASQCPSCRATMQMYSLPAVNGSTVDLDVCFQCQGLWFDPQENLKLSPAAVATLFKLLHEHRNDARLPMAQSIHCPRCSTTLAQGFDVVRSGRYITYRCPNRHGRFSAFSAFMVEKGFVRMLTPTEIEDMAQRVAVIHCSSCGAPVDIRKDHVCPHCQSAFSLLDPHAVEQALQGYANATKAASSVKLPELADAMLLLERDRQRAMREQQAQRGSLFAAGGSGNADLLAVGVDIIAAMLH